MNYQEQAEQEMWDAASRELPPPLQLVYDVFVSTTGARCLSTSILEDAIARADQVDGYVLNRFQQCVYGASEDNPALHVGPDLSDYAIEEVRKLWPTR